MNHSWNNPHPRIRPWSRRPYADQNFARITAKSRLREYHYSNWCVFERCICWSSFQTHGSKYSESHYRHHDKTRLLTSTHYNRRRERFRLPSYNWSNWKTRPKLKTCHNKTCTNNRGPKTSRSINQDLFENGIGRVQETMAKVFTPCNPELQNDLPFQYRLWTMPSISWQSPTKQSRSQTWTTIWCQYPTYYRFCRTITPRNENLSRKNQEKCHAVAHQIRKILRQKSKSLTFRRKRLLFHTAAKNQPSKIKNTVS